MSDPRRDLPSVDRLLREPGVRELLEGAPRDAVVAAVRESIDAARTLRGGLPPDWSTDIRERLARRLEPSLRRVLNATGVVLHTNLGRAPLASGAIEAMAAVAGGYSTLEFDLHAGTRGHRGDHCRGILADLTGAEDALVVNNAAGALVLALNAVAAGEPVLISRGELIEIGGSFRIPDIMEKSGARLQEIGTTNRTHLDDYRKGLESGARAILTVHRSNFEQTGFVHTPDPRELAALAARAGVPYLHDTGSGLLADLAPWGLRDEPRVQDAVGAGADLVLFSGDKLLGGPQAGCIVGRETMIGRCRHNAYARALRADKFTLAGLEATLALYRDPALAVREVPVLAMLTRDPAAIEADARRLADGIAPAFSPTLQAGASTVGGGSFPGARLPTTLVSLESPELGAHGLAARLRLGKPPLVTRIENDRVMIDPRTLAPADLDLVPALLAAALE